MAKKIKQKRSLKGGVLPKEEQHSAEGGTKGEDLSNSDVKSVIATLGLDAFPNGLESVKDEAGSFVDVKKNVKRRSKKGSENASSKGKPKKGGESGNTGVNSAEELAKEAALQAAKKAFSEEISEIIKMEQNNEDISPEMLAKYTGGDVGTAKTKATTEKAITQAVVVPRIASKEKNSLLQKVDVKVKHTKEEVKTTFFDISTFVKKANTYLEKDVRVEDPLLIPPSKAWFTISSECVSSNESSSLVHKDVLVLKDLGERLMKREMQLFDLKFQKKKAKLSDYKWMETVMKTGTLNDKLAAMTLLVQESPLHRGNTLATILNMCKKKSKRESLMAIDCLKNIFLSDLLPDDRKLKHFVQLCKTGEGLSLKAVAVWWFEDDMKAKYAEYLSCMKKVTMDPFEKIKTKGVKQLTELLMNKPEGEDVILSLIVNKVGDPESKVASQATHMLRLVLNKHPGMKSVIASEVQRLMCRSNISDKARYYSTCFLNQMILTKNDQDFANTLIDIYFCFFNIYVSKNEQLQTKLLSALLVGVNRAFPFTVLDEAVYEKYVDQLFKVVHQDNLTTSIQALMLLFHISDKQNVSSDRYYRALYAKLLDPQLGKASKVGLFLNLVYKSVKADMDVNRAKSFVKRLLQIACHMRPSFICGVLLLISEVLKEKPVLRAMITEPEADDEEESFADIKVDEDGEIVESSSSAGDDLQKKNSQMYCPLAREPKYSKAETSCFWELYFLCRHFHPTVALFADTIVKCEDISYQGDPLKDFTTIKFLDRFVYKNPKKKQSDHGGSIMQPKGKFFHGNEIQQGKMKGIVANMESHFSQTVNSKYFKTRQEKEIPADEMFFYQYFSNKKDSEKKIRKDSENSDDEDILDNALELNEDSDGSLDDDEVEEALAKEEALSESDEASDAESLDGEADEASDSGSHSYDELLEYDFDDSEELADDGGQPVEGMLSTDEEREEPSEVAPGSDSEPEMLTFEDSECEEESDRLEEIDDIDGLESDNEGLEGLGLDDEDVVAGHAIEENRVSKRKRKMQSSKAKRAKVGGLGEGSVFASAEDFADIIEEAVAEGKSKQERWESRNSSFRGNKRMSGKGGKAGRRRR
eukprot:Nk52_evm106s914 gene=Nk52_evmTU106s914